MVNENVLVSIVIPIYNVEDYLSKCVDSVINQTYKNLQIILVDDGSKDSSPSICDEYLKKDKRIDVIHKENGGLSDARNVGMKYVKGEFTFFLDSDDWVDESIIENLLNLINEYNADIAISNYYYAYEDRNDTANKVESNLCFEKEKAMKELLSNNIIKNFAWGKLFKTELLHGYEFPKGKLFEDVYWTHLIFDKCNRVVLSKDPLVYYLQRSNSISYSFNEKKIHLVEGYLERRRFVEQYYSQYLYIVDEIIIKLLIGLYIESLKTKQFYKYTEFRKHIKEISKKILSICSKKNINVDLLNDFELFNKYSFLYLLKRAIK